MIRHRARIAFVLLLVLLALLVKFMVPEHFLSVNHLKEHKEQLLLLIRTHYLKAVISYICLYLGTSFFLPGALALTVAGGLMFGVVPAMIYVNIGSTTGAVLAFLAARFLFGNSIQQRFHKPLDRLNKELAQHGHNYLLILRVLPVVPFFVVNYGAGLTRIPLRTFVWTTSLGVIPGSFIYSFIGNELRSVNALRDLFSVKIIVTLVVIALVALAPVVHHHLSERNR